MDRDVALRVELHRCAVLRGDARAADAVEGRGGVGHLDEGGKADAAVDALFAQTRLLGAEPRVVHHRVEIGQRLVVRQFLEFQPRRRLRRIGIVGEQVTPAQLQRVHTDLRRGEFDETFRHRHRDRMADGAVLAHHIFIGEDDAGLRPVVRAGVGPADEVHHLVRLDAGGARIDGVGADAGEVVDLEGGDGAVVLDADLRLDAVVAGVDVGDEAFQPVGDELDRALQHLRQRHRRHLVGIGVHLDAEGAADVLGHDAHLVMTEGQVFGEQVLHHVRRLRALIHGQAVLAGVPVGDDRARLVGNAGMAAGDEGRLDHGVGFGEGLVDGAHLELALEAEIVAERGMDHRGLGIERGLGIGDRRQFFVSHVDQLAGVLRLCARLGDDRAHRLALPAGALHRDRRLRRRLQALEMRQHADPRRHYLGEFGPGDDGDHARRLLGRGLVDLHNARMRVRRAHIGDMRHARQHDVADILPAPLRKAREIRPRHRAADIGVRPVERGEDGGRVFDDLHCVVLTIPVRPRFRGDERRLLPARTRHKNRDGHRIVRHICADGLLSKPRPSFGCLKLRPMMSTKSSRLTFALGSKA